MSGEHLGVVIIGRNEGERLIRCLESVRAATENIVYVDSGSTDGSVAAARAAGAAIVELDLAQPFTAARARNEGFRALKSANPAVRLVQFIDGDCALVPGWIDRAVAFLAGMSDVAVVCGRRRERFPKASIYNSIFDLEWDTPIGETGACGGDAIIRAEALEAVGGFSSALIAGEEPELCVRLRQAGWKIWRLDADMTLHDAAMTRLGQWWRRSVRSGYGFAEVSRLHRASPYRIWGRAVPSAMFWGVLLPLLILCAAIVHPVFLLGFLIYPLQVCWMVVRARAKSRLAWSYALLTMVGKFAQSQGIIKFYWYWSFGQTGRLIEYKR